MVETTYRGYKLVQHSSGNGNWMVYNSLGHVVGGSAGFSSAWSAKIYIDELLSP